MASYTCPVDCNISRVPPTELPAEPDISGIGITIAYTSTAAFALALVVAYYIFVYHPSTGMSGDLPDNRSEDVSRPNPIDGYLLFWRLQKQREDRGNRCNTTQEARIQNAMIHAMLTMSDFQLITGLTILISGFTQLRCGITAYHWQRIVQLSWFSCITHLCCLTFLRQHFMQNKILYAWRLPGMIALVVMLIVARVPTAHYAGAGWGNDSPAYRPVPADFAICYLHSHAEPDKDDMWIYESSQQRMILSAILLGGGMVNRLWHLSRTPTQVYLKVRHTCSRYSRRFLSVLYIWSRSDRPSLWPFLVLVFVYRPLLATFLTFRILIDMIASRAFEVWWLVLSFSYGMQNLWTQKRLPEPGNERWSFGQVVALFILVAPFITSVEGYLHGPNRTTPNEANRFEPQSLSITAPQAQPLSPAPEGAYPSFTADPAPDHDFYGHSFTFPIVIHAIISVFVSLTGVLLYALCWVDSKPSSLFYEYVLWDQADTTPFIASFGFSISCVLLALVAEIQPPRSKAKRRSFLYLYFGGCCAFLVVTYFPSTSRPLALACMGIYFVLSIVRAVLSGLRSKANTSPSTEHTNEV